MEEISAPSYCGMLIIGLKYFAVGNFDWTASEHSANKLQVVVYIISWFIAGISLLGGCFDGTSYEERVQSFAILVCLILSMVKFAMFSLNRNTLHTFIKLIDVDAVTRTKTDVYVKKAIQGIAVTLRSYAFIAIFGSLANIGVAIFSEKLRSQQAERKYWEVYHLYIPYDVIVFERISIPRLIVTIFLFYHGYCQIFFDIVSVSLFTHVGWQFEATAHMFKDVPYLDNHTESMVCNLSYAVCRFVSPCYCALKTRNQPKVFCGISPVSFLCVLSFQQFLYTRCADLTKNKALLVSEIVYLSDWHLTTPSTRRDLIWIIMRAQHPINYSAMGMFPMTMETFSQIIRIAYGAFSMLTSLD